MTEQTTDIRNENNLSPRRSPESPRKKGKAPAVLAAILAGLVAAAGAIVVVGLLVTVPLATLVMAYTCRSLHNEQVV